MYNVNNKLTTSEDMAEEDVPIIEDGSEADSTFRT